MCRKTSDRESGQNRASLKATFAMLGVSGMIVREVLYHVRMPLLEPWVTAYGSQDNIESLFVNLKFDSVDGWGECAPAAPLYNSEYTKGAFAAA